MFGKIFNFLMVCFLSVCNFTLVFTPFLIVILFITTSVPSLIRNLTAAIQFMALVSSLFMVFYLICDYLFGFSIRRIIKKCVPCHKDEDYSFLDYIFNEVKQKFGMPKARLLIKNSTEINAFAVASLDRKYVVLTKGIVNHMSKACSTPMEFKNVLRAIMGHEMSHLANKDFLPGLLIAANRSISSKMNVFSIKVFHILIFVVRIIPFIGKKIAALLDAVSLKVHAFTHWFYKNIVMRVYVFLKKWISRGIEYRCDKQSAKAFGAESMMRALQCLGDSNNYFTIFSTHPSIKNRVENLEGVKTVKANRHIHVGFFHCICNNLAFFMPLTVFFMTGTNVQFNSFTRSILETKTFYQKYYTQQVKVVARVKRNFHSIKRKANSLLAKSFSNPEE